LEEQECLRTKWGSSHTAWAKWDSFRDRIGEDLRISEEEEVEDEEVKTTEEVIWEEFNSNHCVLI
jgi:hypothetical protein